MIVPEREMHVWMRVRFGRRGIVVLMQVMLVVMVEMLMQDGFVGVGVAVMFADNDHNADEHRDGAKHIRRGR